MIMKIDILTLFPEMFAGPFDESIIKRAQEKSLVEINIHNLRDWAIDKHSTVDDKPYGGGPGMILRVDVIDKALKALKGKNTKVILTSAKGETFSQTKAKKLSKAKHLIIIAGHYEGFDQRVYDHLVDEVLSIGNYVLTGGELPAMVITDTIVRLIPRVLGTKESLKEESHSKPGFIEYPQYTRPEDYKGWKVPEILLSGNHAKIEKWRQQKAFKKTKKKSS
jgi:tRNA (guanine37-N1)-methyltransferase